MPLILKKIITKKVWRSFYCAPLKKRPQSGLRSLLLLGCFLWCTISYAQQKNVANVSTGFRQSVNVQRYRGKKFRLHAAVKVLGRDKKNTAQLWAMVENPKGWVSFSDDMAERPITAQKWKIYSIEGKIENDATNLLFGGRANGNGKFLFDDFRISIQSGDGKWQTLPIKNPGFEESLQPTGLPNGWTGGIAVVKKFRGTLTTDAYRDKKAYLIEGEGITGEENKIVLEYAMVTSKANVALHVGKKFRLQIDFKAIGKEELSGLRCFVRVDRQRGEPDGFFSNSAFIPEQTPIWTTFEKEGVLDKDAMDLSFGVIIKFGGQYFLDNFKLSVQEPDGKWKDIPFKNAGFEEGIGANSFPNGWGGNINAIKGFKWSFAPGNKSNRALKIDVQDFTTERAKGDVVIKALNQAVDSTGSLHKPLEEEPFDYLYLSENIGPENIVNDITQDKLGFIWLGTSTGLAKYDGTRFKFYKYSPKAGGPPCDNSIYHIFYISDQELWIGTHTCGLLIFDLRQEKFHQIPKISQLLGNALVEDVVKDDDGDIWIAAQSLGTVIYQPKKDSAYFFFLRKEGAKRALSKTLSSVKYFGKGLLLITEDFQGATYIYNKFTQDYDPLNYSGPASAFTFGAKEEFWTGGWAGSGIGRFSPKQKIVTRFTPDGFLHFPYSPILASGPFSYQNPGYVLKSGVTLDLLYTKNGKLYAATDNGISLFLPRINGFINIPHFSKHPQSSTGNKINCLFEDKQGNIWAGTQGGIRVRWKYKKQFNQQEINIPLSDYGVKAPNIRRILDFDGKSLLLQGDYNLYLFDLQSKNIQNLRDLSKDFEFLQDYPLSYTYLSKDHNTLWIGTQHIAAPGNFSLFRYDLKNRRLLETYHHGMGITKFATQNIVEKNANELWIATWGGLNKLNLETNTFVTYPANPKFQGSLSNEMINKLYLDQRGDLWVGTQSGLNRYNAKQDNFTVFKYDSISSKSISDNVIYDIEEDDDQNLWIATSNGLNLFDRKIQQFKHFYIKDTNFNNIFKSIVKDQQGYLWMTLDKGMARFDPKNRTFSTFNEKDGLGYLTSYDGWRDKNGILYFGGVKDVIYFNPEVRSNVVVPSVRITEFLLSDKVSVPNGPDKLFKRHVAYSSKVVLKHWQNVFTIKFAALDYNNPSQNQYACKLERYDKAWNYVGNKSEMTYSNLGPGHYTFMVKGSNNDGVWNEVGASLKITILAPWYWAWWSKSLYCLILLGAAYSFYHSQLKRQLEHIETIRLREMDQFKTRLYTNITHEFRTPLTVILGMANKIEQAPNRWLQEGVQMIRRNGRNLLRLVNQMLDLAKLEAGSLSLHYVQGDIIAYLRYIEESFHSLADSKDINLQFHADQDELIMDYDPYKLLQIVSNLLSNALKFTAEGGEVLMEVTHLNEGQLSIQVRDTGIGIPAEKLSLIFDRFYQADDSSTRAGEGSGIGLSLSKELVNLLQGTIAVQSELGKGSVFTVILPIHHQAVLNTVVPGLELSDQSKLASARMEDTVDVAEAAPLLLIVEDNTDVVKYLSSHLSAVYRLEVAQDGQAGIDKAIELVPDLILSDVMMPRKDGFTLCDELKNDFRTSHIPIVLLTAKADVESRITGLRRGADAYLNKPFEEEELLAVLENLLALHRILQSKYSSVEFLSSVSTSTPSNTETALEDAFLQEAKAVINDHLDDIELDVRKLCKKLATSRTQLHNKLRALTGMSTTEFIRSIRIIRAKELLISSDLNISTVAYDCGFQSPQYFSKVFKDTEGVNPSDFREQHKKQ